MGGIIARGVATGGISVYIPLPPNQSTLNFFMWLFCLLDPGQIRYHAIYTHPNQIPGYASDNRVVSYSIFSVAIYLLYKWRVYRRYACTVINAYLCPMSSSQPGTNCGFLVTHMAASKQNKPNTQASGHLQHADRYTVAGSNNEQTKIYNKRRATVAIASCWK